MRAIVIWGKGQWEPWLAAMMLSGTSQHELLITTKWHNISPTREQWVPAGHMLDHGRIFWVRDPHSKIMMRACQGVETVRTLSVADSRRVLHLHVPREHNTFWQMWFALPQMMRRLLMPMALKHMDELRVQLPE